MNWQNPPEPDPDDQNMTPSSVPESLQTTATATFAVPQPVQKFLVSRSVSKPVDTPVAVKNIRPKLTHYYAAKVKDSESDKDKQDTASGGFHVGDGLSLNPAKLHTSSDALQTDSSSGSGSSSKSNSDSLRNPPTRKVLERPFACDLCPGTFPNTYLLANHKQGHLEVKEFQCSVCLAYFSTSAKLKEHKSKYCSKQLLACASPGCCYNTHCVDELTNHVLSHGLPSMTDEEFTARYGQKLRNFYNSEKANGNMDI